MVGGAGVPHDVQRKVRARRSKFLETALPELDLTSILQIALRVSPINNPPSHSSAPSDTRQTPRSKSCFSFHLSEAWQPVDPKTHHPHSDIFSSSRVTRPRIWPPGVKGLAILGLTRPFSHNFMHFVHSKCSRGPWPIHHTYQLPAASMRVCHKVLCPSLSRNPFLTFAFSTSFMCFELPLSF
jgi:hypothetical protein